MVNAMLQIESQRPSARSLVSYMTIYWTQTVCMHMHYQRSECDPYMNKTKDLSQKPEIKFLNFELGETNLLEMK